MEYEILCRRSVSDLATCVRIMLDHGWKPQGGMCVATIVPGGALMVAHIEYYQVMVK